MWRKILLILFSAIMVAMIALLVIRGSTDKPTDELQKELEPRPDMDLLWTSSPDWIINLAQLRSMGLDQHWAAQLIKAMAQQQSNNNDHELAIKILQTGYALFPRNAEIAFRLGLEFCLTDPERAGQYFSMAANLDPAYIEIADEIVHSIPDGPMTNFNQWLGLGKALGRAGEWATAEIVFQRTVALAPDEAEAWVLLGQARQQNGQDGSAALFQAKKINATSSHVRASLAAYYAGQRNIPKAIEIYSGLAKDEPDQPIWNIELGNLYSQTGDLIKAYNYFVAAIDLQPDTANYWIALVNFCIRYQIYVQEVGVPAARIAVNLEPENPDAQAVMGEMLLLQSDADSAIRFFTRAVELDEHNSAYLYYLAECYRRTNDRSLAYQYYVKALEEEGNFGYGASSRAKLMQYFSTLP